MDWGRNGVKMSKYKYSLNSKVKGTVIWQLEKYKTYKTEIEKAKKDLIPSCVASYERKDGVSGDVAQRSTENVALRMMSAVHIQFMESTCDAIDRVLETLDDTDKKLIDLIYWQKRYTPEGAGMEVGLTKSSTYQRINKLLGAMALEMGYVDT